MTLPKLGLYITTSIIKFSLFMENNLSYAILRLLKTSKSKYIDYITNGLRLLIYLYSSISKLTY